MGVGPTASLVTLEKSYFICPYWELNRVSLDIQPVAKPHTKYTSQQIYDRRCNIVIGTLHILGDGDKWVWNNSVVMSSGQLEIHGKTY